MTFRLSETIAPAASVTWNGSRDYNQFIDTHRALWNAEEGKYKTRFNPEMVVFADGKKMGVVQEGLPSGRPRETTGAEPSVA